MMKKGNLIQWLTWAAIVVLLVGCAIFVMDSMNYHFRGYGERYYHKNQLELEAYCARVFEENDRDCNLEYDGMRVAYHRDAGMLEFDTGGSGLGSETSYWGFYYSATGKPVGFQGSPVDFTETEDGYYWKEPDGDNWQKSKELAPHWFTYEAHF